MKILIVYPEAFALGWRGAAARLFDLAYGLKSYEWDLQMLSAKEWMLADQTQQEATFPISVIRTPFTGDYPWYIDWNNFFRRLFRGYWKLRGDEFYYRKLAFGWSSKIVSWVKKTNIIDKPDLIWAICTSNLNGIVGGMHLAKHFGAKYIIEFQDPPSTRNNLLDDFCLQELMLCLKSSCKIITTTESYARHIIDKYNLPREIVSTLYLSYQDNIEYKSIPFKKTDRLVLLHTGTLIGGGGRNARIILEAISNIYHANADCKDKILLKLIGGGYGANEAKKLAVNLHIENSVEVVSDMSFKEIQKEMDNADILVVIKYDNEDFDMQIPGKLFQYLGKLKPILGVMRENTEAALIIKKSGLGYVVSNADLNSLIKYLISCLEKKEELSNIYRSRADIEYIASFSRSAMAEKCNKLLKSCFIL